MEARIENAEEDFATLVINPDRDDDVTLYATGRSAELRVPLFAYQARELIAALQPLADTPDAN